jgi:hypothetical protein
LGERLNGIQEVWGSTPHSSTFLLEYGIHSTHNFSTAGDCQSPFIAEEQKKFAGKAAGDFEPAEQY